MHKDSPDQGRPDPHGAFDHPALAQPPDDASDHAPGFDEPHTAAAAARTASTEEGPAGHLPPRASGKRPRSGVVEQLRQRASRERAAQ